jgi:hypothetical protein
MYVCLYVYVRSCRYVCVCVPLSLSLVIPSRYCLLFLTFFSPPLVVCFACVFATSLRNLHTTSQRLCARSGCRKNSKIALSTWNYCRTWPTEIVSHLASMMGGCLGLLVYLLSGRFPVLTCSRCVWCVVCGVFSALHTE